MNYNPAPSADLTSILQTLSSYVPPSQPLQELQNYQQPEVPEDEYDPSAPPTLDLLPAQSRQSKSPVSPSSKPAKRPPPPSTKDITTYPAALRHITTHLLPSAHFTPVIQHLIHQQHKHEREWHAGYVTLQQQLQSRDASRKKLDEVLAAVGGKASSAEGGEGDMSQEAKEKEMRLYVRKVWKAQKDMVKGFEKELGGLGVPFFGEDVEMKWKGKDKELRELRGRVVKLLEDLCGDDEGRL